MTSIKMLVETKVPLYTSPPAQHPHGFQAKTYMRAAICQDVLEASDYVKAMVHGCYWRYRGLLNDHLHILKTLGSGRFDTSPRFPCSQEPYTWVRQSKG
eukprot:5071182-Amphidinium_carterae.1